MCPAAFTVKTPQNPSCGAYNLVTCKGADMLAPPCPAYRRQRAQTCSLGGKQVGESGGKGGHFAERAAQRLASLSVNTFLRWSTNLSGNVGGITQTQSESDQRWMHRNHTVCCLHNVSRLQSWYRVLARPPGEW